MAKKFKAEVIALGSGLGWRVVDIPFDVGKTFGNAGRVPVKGSVNGFPFRTSLFPRKSGPHMLMLNKQMQKGAGVTSVGQKVEIVLELDTKERTVEVPTLLQRALAEDELVKKYYNALNYSTRKWMAEYVTQPKSAAAQQRRAEQIVMRLFEMMEGERTPPPILQAVFARSPKAREGWEKLPPSHKRGHLFGIFSTQGPEARERRLQKAVDMMIEYAEKPRTK